MKWFDVVLVGALFVVPTAACVAQAAQEKPAPPVAPPASTAPPSSTGAVPASPSANSGGTAPASNVAESGVANTPHYVIGSEDNLQITVWKEPSLSGTIPVRPDGMISMNLLGDLTAAGRTPMQLANDITVRLKKYVQDPNVSVVVLAVNSQRIYMVGEVGHVGPIPLAAGMTPLQAIATAGGLSPFANSKKIYIMRTVDGKAQKIPFNYKVALKGGDQGVALKSGDTIVVP
ncbi:MAG TPA: polysaccharide biosynthesis/export family protein [Edaphobacter sp.]